MSRGGLEGWAQIRRRGASPRRRLSAYSIVSDVIQPCPTPHPHGEVALAWACYQQLRTIYGGSEAINMLIEAQHSITPPPTTRTDAERRSPSRKDGD